MSNEESPETAPHDEDAPATAPAAPAPGRRRQSASGSAAAVIASAADSPRPVVIEPTTPSRSFWTRIDRPFVFGFLVTLGGLGAIVIGLALSNLSTVLIYIGVALFLSLGLDPIVSYIERKLPRPAAVTIVVVVVLVHVQRP